MPLTIQQTTNIIENIEVELKVLKEFSENKKNQSTSLLDLINFGKSQELINNTTKLQNIFLHDEDLKIKQAILDLFEEGKNKGLIKQLSDIKDKFEKLNQTQINSLINTFKNKQKTDEKIKYIYLRILFRKISIANLAKLKLLTDIIGQNEISGYIKILQNKFSEQGRAGEINFIHLNNIFDKDTEKELRRLGDKKKIKRPAPQAVQSEHAMIVEPTTITSSHLDSSSDLSSSSEKNSTSITSQSIDSKPFIVGPSKTKNFKVVDSFVDSLLNELNEKKITIRNLNSKIIILENEIEQLKKQTKQETQPETSSVKAGLDNIKLLLQNRQNTAHSEELNKKENLIKDLKLTLQEENKKTKALTDEIETLNSQYEKSIQKLEADLNQAKANLDQSQKSINISNEEAEKSKQASEDLKKRINNLQNDYDSQRGHLKRVNSELETTKKLLKETQDNSSQKDVHLEKIGTQLKETIAQLTIESNKLTDEKETLHQNLTQAQEKINFLEKKISNHQNEIKGLSENSLADNEKISDLKSQINELNKLKTHYEKSIQELGSQITDKEAHLEGLSSMLNDSHQKVQQLKRTINSIETEKKTLGNKLEQLEQKNKKELQELQNKLKNLEVNFEISKKDYSSLKTKYDNLKKEFKEKTQDLNLIKADLESSKTETTDARQQNGLYSLKKEERPMKDREVNYQLSMSKSINQNIFNPFQDLLKVEPSIDHSDSSSGRGSINSSSSDLTEDEDLNHSSSRQENIPQVSSDEAFSDSSSSGLQPGKLQFSDGKSLEVSEEEDELTKNTASRPSILNADTCIPTSNQQDKDREATLEEIKQGVNAAFKQENHPAIIDALINKFLQIATDTANKLFKGNVNYALHRFEPKLKKIASDQITESIFPHINNSPDFKARFSEKIHTNKLIASNYLEEVINSTELIFDNLTIGNPAQNYKDNISDQGKNLLIKLCIKNLQTNEKESLLELAKNNLVKQASENDLKGDEYAEIIQSAAEELRTKLLETENLQKTLEEIIKNPIVDLNLLAASKQKLQDQVVQEICDNFVNYFPNLHLDPILEKINNGKTLSNEEIAKLPSELQYANTVEEFVSSLRVEYPNLSLNYVNKINEDAFKQLRLTLRKNALNALPLAAFEDKEILDLSAKLWLEKKLQQITKKSISLKLDGRDQKDLDNNFQKYFRLSSLEDMAITYKSIDELKNELKKLHDFKLKTTTEFSKAFSEIESKLLRYPNLITEDGSFQANLNNALPHNFPKLSDNDKYPMLSTIQIQILLDKINLHLKNDVSKWSLLNNNKIVQEIANNIIFDSTNPFESGTDIQRLVSDSLTILYKHHDLQETLEKRKYWNSEIQHRYALTQKLKSSSHFNQMVEDRISKLEEMLKLKENDADENVKALPKAVYLPNKCRVIPNFQFDSSENPEEYHLQVDNFYKQDALKVGKTITFSQKLANEDECKWSATLNNDKCLSFKTQKKRFRREKNYLQEVSFAQMIYSVNSFKNAKTCTLNFGNCSQNMKERLYLFAKAYNELRLEDNELQKRPKINCNIKNPPNLDKAKFAAVKEEIKAQLNLHSHELQDISTKLKDDTMRHQIIRSRG